MVRTDRAVEILHNAGTEDEPDWSVGSGYLIGGRRVLTAAHNVGAGQCLVRFIDGSEHAAAVRQQGDEIRLDLAVMELTGDGVPDPGEPVSYAIVSQGQAELIPRCTGLGFPRFKEDETRPRPGSGKPLRNIEQLDGEIPTAAGALSSLLTFRVTARPQEQPPLPAGAAGFGESAWQGISGTVVFARDDAFGERAIGVVTEHHLAEGGSALTLVPIGAIGSAGAVSTGEQRAWWEMIGVPDPDGLPVLPRLSASRRRPSPAPPRGTVARPQLLAEALAALCDGSARVVALAGPPGFGKSVLARLIAAAIETKEGSKAPGCCPGGVVWLDVGQDPDLSGLLAQVLTDLTGQSAGGRSVEQLASDLNAELAARRCLLMLDDVWPSRTGKNDVVGRVLCRIELVPRLVTTRSVTLFDAESDARCINVGEMGPGEATDLLATALPGAVTENDEAQLGGFARQLGHWPLLLGLAAAHLRRLVSGGISVDEAVRELSGRYASKGVTAFDARHADQLDISDPAQRERAVAAAVQASLTLLTSDDQTRYRELAVFPPGQPTPVSVIAGLWAPSMDQYDTEDLLTSLGDLSMLSLDWRTRQVRVHDLIRAYLLPADPEQKVALHRQLLQGWGDPLQLKDSYKVRWYAYHLDNADDSERLYALITPAWRDRVLAVTGALSDVSADSVRAAEHAARRHNLPEELRFRLITAAVAARARALPRPLLAVLARLGQADRAVGYAALIAPGERIAALTDIASALAGTDPGRARGLADQAIAAAGHIDDPADKAEALTGIASVLADPDPGRARGLADQAIAAAGQIDDPADKAEALAGIASVLADPDPGRARGLADQAIAAAGQIDDDVGQDRALARVVAKLARTDPDRVRPVADRIDYPWPKAEALASIAAAIAGTDPVGAGELTKRAMAAANTPGMDPWDRADVIISVLTSIATALARTDPARADELIPGAWFTLRSLPSGERAMPLADIAAALAAIDPGRALEATDRIDDPAQKTRALAEIAGALAATNPRRANEVTGQALATAAGITSSSYRTQALAGIASALASTDPGRALAAADRIDDTYSKEQALVAIAAALADTDPDHALAAADRIDDPEDKAEALAGIAAALAGTDPGRARGLADQAIAIADHIGATYSYSMEKALAAIAAALADTDPDHALAAADHIDDLGDKIRALATIAAALAPGDPDRAHDVADQAMATVNRIDDTLTETRWRQNIREWMTGEGPLRQAEELAAIAAALAPADPGLALAAADRIDDPADKARALTRIASALAGTDAGRAGELADQAIAAADRIDNPVAKREALADIAPVLADTDPGRALAAADRIDDPADKARALTGIASALTAADPDRALAAADRIDDPADKARALTGIASALTGTDPDRARDLADQAIAAADRIDDPADKARALTPIASALARTHPGYALTIAELIDDHEAKTEMLDNITRICMTYDLAATGARQSSIDVVNELITHLRAVNPEAGNEAWWTIAQFFVTSAESASELNVLVRAVLAAAEW
jgi:hypothetical protein